MMAGLTAVAAIMATDASAQDCPEWFKWFCPSDASSPPVASDGIHRERPLSRTNPSSDSAMDRRSKRLRTAAATAVKNPKSQQKQTVQPAGAATAARPSPNGDPSSERHLARREGRQGSALTEQEKEELFREFLEWQSARPSATQTSIIRNSN
jgi:hypothetical protein